jgi:hypothetical protein
MCGDCNNRCKTGGEVSGACSHLELGGDDLKDVARDLVVGGAEGDANLLQSEERD